MRELQQFARNADALAEALVAELKALQAENVRHETEIARLGRDPKAATKKAGKPTVVDLPRMRVVG